MNALSHTVRLLTEVSKNALTVAYQIGKADASKEGLDYAQGKKDMITFVMAAYEQIESDRQKGSYTHESAWKSLHNQINAFRKDVDKRL